MKNFDDKWKECARIARNARCRAEEAPFGFASRVVALGLRSGAPEMDAWDRLLPRWLAGAIAMLAFCAIIEAPHFRDAQPLNPRVENTVAKLLWKL